MSHRFPIGGLGETNI